MRSQRPERGLVRSLRFHPGSACHRRCLEVPFPKPLPWSLAVAGEVSAEGDTAHQWGRKVPRDGASTLLRCQNKGGLDPACSCSCHVQQVSGEPPLVSAGTRGTWSPSLRGTAALWYHTSPFSQENHGELHQEALDTSRSQRDSKHGVSHC